MIENKEDDGVEGKTEYILFQSGRSQIFHFGPKIIEFFMT